MIARVREHPALAPGPLFLGGKSMGGRVATLLAAAGEQPSGLVLLGYPLHPPGHPERLRTGHLARVRAPMLFVQGSRDPLCDLDRLRGALAGLAGDVTVHVVEGGDHSFEPARGSGRTVQQAWSEALTVVTDWVRRRAQG